MIFTLIYFIQIINGIKTCLNRCLRLKLTNKHIQVWVDLILKNYSRINLRNPLFYCEFYLVLIN